MLKKTLAFLQNAQTFYVATVDEDKPRVRPFGLVLEFDGKLWFGTANTKSVYQQLQANPRVEISATLPSMEWIRLSGNAVFENNSAVKQRAFELMPSLAQIYQGPENPVFEMFYISEAEVLFQSMASYGEQPKTYRF